jgi:hypothetical protein
VIRAFLEPLTANPLDRLALARERNNWVTDLKVFDSTLSLWSAYAGTAKIANRSNQDSNKIENRSKHLIPQVSV